MEVPALIRQGLAELGIEQRALATAAQVTDSYISQLLTRKKASPAPNRIDIYEKMELFLRLPHGELSKLAGLQRTEVLQRQLGDPLTPLFKDVRALILRKCDPKNQTYIRTIFERTPFGELERLVTQKLLKVVQHVVKEELAREPWLRQVAELSSSQQFFWPIDFIRVRAFQSKQSSELLSAFREALLTDSHQRGAHSTH